MIAFIVCVSAALGTRAQTMPNADQSWTATSQTTTDNANPSRTKESHTKSGNRTLDRKTVEVLGPDGQYQPYVDVETETIEEGTATRSITRTYNPGADGHEHLTQVTDSKTQKSGDGGANVVRTTSNVDLDGNSHVVEREVSATTKGSESEDTQTTVYRPDARGNLTPSMQIHEQQKHGVNGDIQTKKTTLLPDASGGWQVYEVRERTVKGNAQARTTEDRASRRDFEGNVAPVSQVITKEANVNGQTTSTVETHSVDVPGSAREETLRPVQRATTVGKTEPGRTATEQQIEVLYPGAPSSIKTMNIVVVGTSGTEETNTTTVQYSDSYPSVVSVEMRKSDQAPAIQVQGAPSGNPDIPVSSTTKK
jgi:hypothetical protein